MYVYQHEKFVKSYYLLLTIITRKHSESTNLRPAAMLNFVRNHTACSVLELSGYQIW